MRSDNLEFNAMKKIGAVLGSLKDIKTRERVLGWAFNKFIPSTKIENPAFNIKNEYQEEVISSGKVMVKGNEIPGIAVLNGNGSLDITIRDLKAKNLKDAAIRFALVFIRAYEKLTGKNSVSSRKQLSPAMRDYRIYDGNTRHAIANYRGINRNRDLLSLDSVAKREADNIISEIGDDKIKTKWQISRIGKIKRKRRLGNKQK